MKQDVRLYIANQQVDFSGELSLPFNYELESLTNPTVIKNTFTKKITIVGTPNNNKIFGGIYNLDREQILDDSKLISAYFNPSLRTPFQLFRNGELVEDGYMQLNNVVLKNKVINYNITLYGGIGDFFYNLSYNNENEPLQLKNLDYGQDLSFVINKKIIKESWSKLNGDGDTKPSVSDYITFIPSYNGLYTDFDNNHLLINTNKSKVFPSINQIVDGISYGTRNGYYLGELNKDYTEWEAKNLMSYKQRPALRMKKFFDAICNPDNNGGYEVELDNSFFNNNNPYYNNAYIALPLLESKFNAKNETIEDNIKLGKNNYVGNNNGSLVASTIMPIVTVDNDTISTNINGVVDTAGLNNSTTFDVDFDFQLFFNSNTPTTSTLYPSAISYYTYSGAGTGEITSVNDYLNSTLVYVNAINFETKEIVAQSNLYNFTNKISLPFLNKEIYSKPSDWDLFFDDGVPVVNVFGVYEYDTANNRHYFKDENGNNTFTIKIEDCKKAENICFQVFMWAVSNKDMSKQRIFEKDNYFGYEIPSTEGVKGWFNIKEDTNTSNMVIKKGAISLGSGQLIEQDILLKTDNKPLDFLLGYCKLFDLKFSSVIGEKKIKISKKNNYFTGNIINIDNKIDYSKDLTITPLLYDKKFYKLSLPSNDSYIAKTYKNEYSIDYGQKRINTNYNFNSETKDLFDNNIYQNVISMCDVSEYYRNFYDDSNNPLPPFLVDNITIKKYNTSNNELKEYKVEVNGNDKINLQKTVDWNVNSGYDYTDKLCCFDKDGNNKSLSDITASLVFFDGMYTPTDIEGNTIQYWVSDDTADMYEINGKMCHLYTEDEFDTKNNWIAWKVPYLPKFSRYRISNNQVIDSWDMGKPREVYIPNLSYEDNVTIYNQYWEDTYKDKLDINTKLVSAYVDLSEFDVNENMLKDFYFFNNSYWILNKIENYDINSRGTVKCDFIRVNNIPNYTKETSKYYDYFFTDKDSVVVGYISGKIVANINSSTDWSVDSYDRTHIQRISPTSGMSGTTKVEVYYTANNLPFEDVDFSATFKNNYDETIVMNILQHPNMMNKITLTGKISTTSGNLNNMTLEATYVSNNNVISTVNIDSYDGEYSIYLPKDTNVKLTIYRNGTNIWSEQVKYQRDNVKNITILML